MTLLTRRLCLQCALATGMGPLARATSAQADCRTQRGLVILAEFPGLARTVDRNAVAERFRRLDHYVREMSYGRVCTSFDFTDWLTLPEPIASYTILPANLQVDRSRIFKIIQHAIDAADAAHDFSRYDFMVLFMKARFEDYGMIGLCGYPGMLGWAQPLVFRTQGRGQVVPGGMAIFTASAHLGTLFHDIAHVWGGVVDGKRQVPCLYDHDLQERHPTRATGWENALINMGYWDPMSCHFIEPSLPPPGISSWTKLRLGWLPPEKVRDVVPGAPVELVLGPLEDGKAETLAIRIRLDAQRYLLIENRQPLGAYDRVLPGHGVLIMKADDSIAECRHGRAPVRLVNANPALPALRGAAFALPGRSQYTDEEYQLDIRLLEKIGDSYRIRISRTGEVGS